MDDCCREYGAALDERRQIDETKSRVVHGFLWPDLWLSVIDLCVVFVVPFLLYMMLLLALVTAMEGLKFSVRRFQGLAALTFFGGMIYLYARSYTTAVDSLSFLGRYNTVVFLGEGSMKVVMQLSHLAYPFLAFTVLLFAGLWLFEKRVEI